MVNRRRQQSEDAIHTHLVDSARPPLPLAVDSAPRRQLDLRQRYWSPTSMASDGDLSAAASAARAALDAHTVETVAWHFHESTGCPFWLEKKRELKFDPLTEIKSYDDLKKFP